MKKILIFSLVYYPRYIGGAEVAIKEITDRISSKEVEFDMITLRFDSSLPFFEKIGNVNVYRIGFAKKKPTMGELVKFPMYLNKVFFPVTSFFKALSLNRLRRYDASWAMMSYMGFPALFLNWFTRIPIILTLQEGDSIAQIIGRHRIRMVFLFYRMIFKKASTVQVISTYLGNFARDMGYKGTIEVIPNGVDISRFQTTNTELHTGTTLVTTSRLVKKNGIGDVIRSLTLLPPDVTFLILGIGPLEQELKVLTKKLGLESRVIFAGFVDQKEIPTYLHKSDIFIRPSLSEGMGNSFIEAMAAGIPVIATSVGGIPDFLKDRETGLFVEVENPKDIAEKVKLIVNDQKLREILIVNGEKLAQEKYDWDLIAREMRERVFVKNP